MWLRVWLTISNAVLSLTFSLILAFKCCFLPKLRKIRNYWGDISQYHPGFRHPCRQLTTNSLTAHQQFALPHISVRNNFTYPLFFVQQFVLNFELAFKLDHLNSCFTVLSLILNERSSTRTGRCCPVSSLLLSQPCHGLRASFLT